MQDNLHTNQMDELASEGWTQMKDLLQKHDLEEKKKPGMIAFWAYRIGGIAACILLAVAAFTYFSNSQTDHKNIAHLKNNNLPIISPQKENTENDKNDKNAHITEKTESTNSGNLKLHQAKTNQPNPATRIIIQNIHHSPNTIYLPVIGQDEKIDKLVLTSFARKIKEGQESIKVNFKNPAKIDSLKNLKRPDLKIDSKKKTGKLPVEFYAGAGFNISGKKSHQNVVSASRINIHPSVRVIFPLNDKFSIQTGLYAFSSINAKEASAKEKELVNNINANLYYKINTTNIVKAAYFDVPITINYKLSKNWTAGTGLEISRLHKFDVKEVEESYDYNENLTATSVERFVGISTYGAQALKNKITIKKWEPRLVLETTFKTGPLLLSAGYHYGLSSSITIKEPNGTTNHFKNEYFKVGVQYQLK